MAETYNIPRDSTLKELIDREDQRNAYLAVLSAESMGSLITDYAAIQRIVRAGLAPQVFGVGDQINIKWTYDSKEYTWPWNITHFSDVELEDGEVVPGMWLQAHYATPLTVAFDAREAFYYAADGLSAGMYYFTFGYTWGAITEGDMYQFTLSEAVPAGAQLYFASNAYDGSLDGTNVEVYESADSTTPLQTAQLSSVTSGSGTNLGIMTRAFQGNLGSEQAAAYGHNRWATSAYRQWLNSAEAAGKWWEPQSNFDRPTAQASANAGFMSGFEDDFLSIIRPIKVTTALNTVDGLDIGTQEDTYDRFFLASLEQMYINPQLSGVEGDAWDYWKRATGSSAFIGRNNVAGTFPITYELGSGSAYSVRLRSAGRSNASTTWYITSTGAVSTSYASSAFRCAPACVIC